MSGNMDMEINFYILNIGKLANVASKVCVNSILVILRYKLLSHVTQVFWGAVTQVTLCSVVVRYQHNIALRHNRAFKS